MLGASSCTKRQIEGSGNLSFAYTIITTCKYRKYLARKRTALINKSPNDINKAKLNSDTPPLAPHLFVTCQEPPRAKFHFFDPTASEQQRSMAFFRRSLMSWKQVLVYVTTPTNPVPEYLSERTALQLLTPELKDKTVRNADVDSYVIFTLRRIDCMFSGLRKCCNDAVSKKVMVKLKVERFFSELQKKFYASFLYFAAVSYCWGSPWQQFCLSKMDCLSGSDSSTQIENAFFSD